MTTKELIELKNILLSYKWSIDSSWRGKINKTDEFEKIEKLYNSIIKDIGTNKP